MRLLSVKSDVVALDSFRAQHHSQREPQTFENRSLLNMQFEISAGVFAFALRLRKTVNLHTTAPQRVFHFHAVAIGAAAIGGDGMRSRECGGAQQTAAEA